MVKPMVLVVDDQPEYARLISISLASEGFEVRTACGGDEAIEKAAELHPDVVLLDVHMPGQDGYEVMSGLRERWPVPVIMVTGDDHATDRRAGLDRGADDYVTKPFSPLELAARARAVMRRSPSRRGPTGQTGRETTTAAGPELRHAVGRSAWRILELLTANPDKVLYQDELLAHAFGPEFVGDARLLQEQIRRLRRALGVRPWAEGPIRTVRGIGYVYDASGKRDRRAATSAGQVAATATTRSGRRPLRRTPRRAVEAS
jgi:DNA-binding response OmpR family regulator